MRLAFDAQTSPHKSSFLKAQSLNKEELVYPSCLWLPLPAILPKHKPSLHQFEITSMVMVKRSS